MAVAEKYRAKRDFKHNGVSYTQGDPIDRAAIVAVNPENEGKFLRTRYIELDPVTRPIDGMSKPELVELGRTLGLKVNSAWRKPDLVEAIGEAM